MVYEKYIRKNGKLYGPYTYHSKRVDGKVVSEYHGVQNKSKNFNFLWLVVGIFLIVVLISGFLFFNARFSGKVSLDITSNYKDGEILEGVLSLSLKEGELIPASSKVIFEVKGNSYEYTLSDIVTGEIIKGDFYVEDKSILGRGEGYGAVGTKIVYPDVFFTLNIFTEKSSSSGNDFSDKENNKVPENILSEEGKIQEEIAQEVEEQVQEVVEDELQEIVEENLEIEVQEIEELEEEVKELKEVSEEPEDYSEVSVAETTITGEIIRGFLKSSFNFFQTITGQVSLKLAQEIKGSASFGESFTYDLSEGETAEIKSGSVKVNKDFVDEAVVDLDIINNQIIVTTDYSIKEEGFGTDYLGGVGQTISIDLSKLNLAIESEDIKVSFVYDNIELVSIFSGEKDEKIPTENPEKPKELIEVPEINVTENLTNETIENITEIINITLEKTIVVEFLTDNEKEILEEEYGNVSVEITKAEKIRERIEVTFEFESYSTKHSYDFKLNENELVEWIERDRIRFLKDIANELSKEESISEAVDGIIGSYSI